MGKLDQNLTVFKKKILFCPKKGIDFRTMGFEICCGRQVLYFSLKKYAEEGYNNILTYQKLLLSHSPVQYGNKTNKCGSS